MKKWVCFYIVINILLLRENLPLEIVWQGWSRRKSSYQHDVDNCYIFVEISEMCCNFKRHFLWYKYVKIRTCLFKPCLSDAFVKRIWISRHISRRIQVWREQFYNWIKALYHDIIPLEKVVMKVSDEYMTGKEVVNLIRKLREKGMNSDEILDIIEYIETHDPKEDSK